MQVNIKTYKPFMSAVNDLKEKYGEHFEYYNGFHDSQLSLTEFIDNFIDVDTVADATIDPNANSATKDIRTLLNDMMKPYQKLLCFNKIFYELTKKYNINVAREWLEAEWNGTFYLHNAHTSTYLPYCFAYDLDSIVEKGLFFLDSFGAKPAKHLTTFNNHVLEFVSWVSNRSSGAVGLPSYLIYSFWFWKNDVDNGFYLKSPEYYRDQSFQEVIYNLNQPYLRVTESTFSNFTIMDREYITEIFGGRTYPDGTYVIDYLDELINYQKAFMKVVSKIRYERMMTFPVITFSLLAQNPKLEKMKRKNKQAVEIADNILNIIYEDYAKNNESLNSFKNHIKSNSKLLTILENKIHDKLKQENIDIDENELIEAELDKVRFIDEDFAKWCVKHNMEWNDSNFYIGNDVTSLSSCCRLISNFDELNKSKKAKGFINSIGGTSLRIGSVQVNTINLVRIAKLVKCLNCDSLDEEIEMYIKILDHYQSLSNKVLDTIRHIIERNIEKGLLPNYTHNLISLNDQYLTQGLTGMYETIREFGLLSIDEFNNETYSDKGYEFAMMILDRVKSNADEWSNNKEYSINQEFVPGESANVKLFNKDRDLFENHDEYKKLFSSIAKIENNEISKM